MTPAFPPRRRVGALSEVIATIDEIVDWASCAASPLGYFGAIYGRITREIERAIKASIDPDDPEEAFTDPVRMERFGVVFANRYLDALWAFQCGEPCPRSWTIAFDTAACESYTIMQHLMLGINAHMRFDLCIAAVIAARAEDVEDLTPLKPDFDQVNDVLEGQIPRFRAVIDELSPGRGPFEWFGWQEFLVFRWYENALLAGISRLMREQAWDLAEDMVRLTDTDLQRAIVERDTEVARFRDLVLPPDSWFGRESASALKQESRDVAHNIGRLR